MESSITRNQENENSENSRAKNEAYFHCLKTGDDDIFVVKYSICSRPIGTLCTKSEISAKSEAEGLKTSKSAVFPRDAQKNTFLMSAKSTKNRRGRKMYQKNTPLECGAYYRI